MDLEREILAARKRVRQLKEEHASERKSADKLLADMKESGKDIANDSEAFEKVDEAFKRSDGLRDEISDAEHTYSRILEIAGQKADERRDTSERREAREVVRAATVGQRFAESDALKHLRSQDLSLRGTRANTEAVEVATRDEFMDGLRQRTTIDNTAGSGGGVIWSDRLTNLIVPIPVRQVRLLDVIAVGSTDTDTIEWVNETTVTDAAAETAFGTAVPESAYGYTKTSTTVKRMGHWVPATKGSLADSAQLQTLVNSRLVRGFNLRLENQVYQGNGTGENLKGILNTSGVLTQARGADTRWDSAHKAITKVRVNLFEDPSAVVLSPTDFESITLEKDSVGNYVNSRGANEPQSIWGLQPVVTALATDSAPTFGLFNEAQLWLRTGVSLAASDQHSDFFIRGLVALLAEGRMAFAVLQPKAFVLGSGW